GQHRHVGLAEHDRAGSADARDYCRVGRRNLIGERWKPCGSTDAGGLESVLDRHGHAVEGTEDLTARESRIGLVGAPPSTVDVQRYDSIERPSAMLNAIEDVIQNFTAGELSLANASRQLGG